MIGKGEVCEDLYILHQQDVTIVQQLVNTNYVNSNKDLHVSPCIKSPLLIPTIMHIFGMLD